MKLLYITRVAIPSVAAQSVQIRSMCISFAKILEDNFELISTKTNENINIEYPFKWKKIPTGFSFNIIRYFEFAFKALLYVLQKKPTNVFTRDILVAGVCYLFGYKVTYEIHKDPVTYGAKLLYNLLFKRKRFTLVTISNALTEYCLRKYKNSRDAIITCHDGVFVENYDLIRNVNQGILRNELKLPLNATIITHTGSLYEGRGAELFKIILDNFENIIVLQVGGRVDDINKWKKYYQNYNNIVFVSHQEDNQKLIKYQIASDLLFLPMTKSNPIWWCTSPMKLFEYMASGVPILVSNVGSVGEVLNDDNAIIFDYENDKSIIESIDYFINQKEKCQLKANNALQDVQMKYTWDKRAKTIIDFMKN